MRKFRSFLCLVVVGFCILIISSSFVYASQEYRHDLSVIIAISKALDIDISYEVFQVLYDGDDKVVAVAYKVNSEGYIVIDKENADIVEYNINTNHYFNFNEEEKILYGGRHGKPLRGA